MRVNGFLRSSANYTALSNNHAHEFARRHALGIWTTNSVYTLIPKNACSTLRLTIALENGCIESPSQGNWIHENNKTFQVTLREAATAQYTFVVLRCPFRRLASVFLDKFISKEPEAWIYRSQQGRNVNLDDLTFDSFLRSLQDPRIRNCDIHWKAQSQFLLYDKYDDYFCVEQMQSCIDTLKRKINLNVVDARGLTQHGADRFESIQGEAFSEVSAFDIALLKRSGRCPTPESLYTEELVGLVKRFYSEDVELFLNHFDSSLMLFG